MSEAARQALPTVEREIEIAQLRVDRLREREKEWLNPAVVELA